MEFTGKERDLETGLDYFGARYYGSALGRFTTPDSGVDQHPEDPQSWNLYSYGRNNPLNGIDPDGRNWVTDLWQDIRNKFTYGHWVTDANLEGALANDAQKAKDELRRQEVVIQGQDSDKYLKGKSNKEIVDTFKLYNAAKNAGRVAPIMPLPPGVTQSDFGKNVMKWGTGDAAARARLETLTKEELEASGVTKEMAETWRDFYKSVKQMNPTNPSAAGRAELMQKASDLLGGK